MKDLYELWLHGICSYEPEIVEKMIVLFGNSDGRFSSPEMDVQNAKKLGIPEKFGKRLSDAEFYNQACNVEAYCKENHIRIINQENEEYSEFLRNINTPPRILFAKGEKI